MDEENVVHVHNGVLHSREKHEIMKFADKWMEPENVILSEDESNIVANSKFIISKLLPKELPAIDFPKPRTVPIP
ncbi:hypothetical protein STEG23_028793 [Scotinomys teguina]